MWVPLWIYSVLLFIVPTVAGDLTVIDTTNQEIDYCSDFECKLPRKERFQLTELVNTNSVGKVYPTNIVLFRCRISYGCCDSSGEETCGVSKKTDVCIKFEFDVGHRLLSKFIIVSNHTECSCQEKRDDEQEGLYDIKDKCHSE